MITRETIERAQEMLAANKLDADVDDFSIVVTKDMWKDLAFSQSLWARFRRKYLGLTEYEVMKLIEIYALEPNDGGEG